MSNATQNRNGISLEITITVNGRETKLAAESTISDFLDARELNDRLVAVELNGQILKRLDFPSTVIAAGDEIEIVHFVGGG
jgi:sulfur carrier protein